MPDGITLQFSVARNVGADGNIIIEGTGIAPTVKVPVTEETLLTDGDPILDYAVDYLNEATLPAPSADAGEVTLGEPAEGELTAEYPRQRCHVRPPEDMTLDF
jgi:hypothetical protein